MEFQEELAQSGQLGIDGVVPMVDAIIAEGLRRGASDIHMEPLPESLSVRYRMDGVLRPAITIPTKLAANAVSRVKVLAELLTYQTDVPQEGRINREKVGAKTDLRVSTFPTVRGEKAVVRLFDSSTHDVPLEELGYPPDLRGALEMRLRMPQGVIFLTGPAGSGKTTTIYAALRYVIEHSRGQRHIVTVEDPVERMIAGVTQTQVHPATGLTFARCLRSLMRQDPEVILVGEVRDPETAEIAVEAGLTGHQVISTIHSGTAAGVFTRLLDMKVPPHLIASSVSFVAAQRLIRKLCLKCRRPASKDESHDAMPGNVYSPVGCEDCFGTGYAGRTVIVEAVGMAGPLHQRILARSTTEDFERAALSLGMVPLRIAAREAIRSGVTSREEIERVIGPELAEAE